MKTLAMTALAVLTSWGVQAATVDFDNLGFAVVNNIHLGDNPSGIYASFTSAGGASLTALTMRLTVYGPNDGHSFHIGLYGDSSTSPGALIAHLETVNDNDSDLSFFGNYSVNLASTPALSAGRYWIGLTTSDSSSASWGYTYCFTCGTGAASEYYEYGSGVYANDGGAGTLQMMVEESVVVPEPSTWILGAAGIALVLVRAVRVKVSTSRSV